MSNPPSALKAALECKCPRCRKGDLYTHPAYDVKNFQKMHAHCPHCGFKYEIEAGFFWGAMYFTYAFSVALFLPALIIFVVFRPPVIPTILALFVVVFVAMPISVRYSRIALLYLFGGVNFRPDMFNGENLRSEK